MQQLLPLRYVAAGGAVGGVVQWAAMTIAPQHQAAETTFILNLVGSVLLGVLLGRSKPRPNRSNLTTNQFLLVGTGFCGALTTFSSFAVQVATALEDGAITRAATIAATTAGVTLVGAGLGYRVGARR